MLNIKELRREYRLKSLDIKDLDRNPFFQFSQWFTEALAAKIDEPNAMALATATTEGRPSCRMILLKEIDLEGFIFFTNYDSRKGKELSQNPFACCTFYWRELERQVIIEGKIEKLREIESEKYFALRPRGSQLATWASHQDQLISSREELEKTFQDFTKKYKEIPVPIPPYWGGYRLIPQRFEFWQGRVDRLHDRFCYQLINDQWKIDRLAP